MRRDTLSIFNGFQRQTARFSSFVFVFGRSLAHATRSGRVKCTLFQGTRVRIELYTVAIVNASMREACISIKWTICPIPWWKRSCISHKIESKTAVRCTCSDNLIRLYHSRAAELIRCAEWKWNYFQTDSNRIHSLFMGCFDIASERQRHTRDCCLWIG